MSESRVLSSNDPDQNNSTNQLYFHSSDNYLTPRLFPLAEHYTAAWSATIRQPSLEQNLSIAIHAEQFYAGRHSKSLVRKDMQNLGTLKILPSGYYFQNSMWTNAGTKELTLGTNLCNAIDGDSCFLNETLDPALIAEISNDLLGVSADRKSLFSYSVLRMHQLNNYLKISDIDFRRVTMLTKPHYNDNATGRTLFTLPDGEVKIQDIAFVHNWQTSKLFLMIALNNGELKYAQVSIGTFQFETDFCDLLPPQENVTNSQIKLFATHNNLLLAHMPESRQLFCWDFGKTEPAFSMYWCPNMHNVTLSACGMYLTGLHDQDAEVSNGLFCLNLHTRKTTNVSLPESVADLVVGGEDGRVCIPGGDVRLDGDSFKNLNFTGGVIRFGMKIDEFLANSPKLIVTHAKAHLDNSLFNKPDQTKVRRRKAGYEDGFIAENPTFHLKYTR